MTIVTETLITTPPSHREKFASLNSALAREGDAMPALAKASMLNQSVSLRTQSFWKSAAGSTYTAGCATAVVTVTGVGAAGARTHFS
jgi:hypothetical protein